MWLLGQSPPYPNPLALGRCPEGSPALSTCSCCSDPSQRKGDCVLLLQIEFTQTKNNKAHAPGQRFLPAGWQASCGPSHSPLLPSFSGGGLRALRQRVCLRAGRMVVERTQDARPSLTRSRVIAFRGPQVSSHALWWLLCVMQMPLVFGPGWGSQPPG